MTPQEIEAFQADADARAEIKRRADCYPALVEALEWLVEILPDPGFDNNELQRTWTKNARKAIAATKEPV